MQHKVTSAKLLTYAGIAPFVGTAALSLYGPNIAHLNLEYALHTYSVVIVCFIAGIHWGLYLFKDTPDNLFIRSNIVTVLAWGSLFLPIQIGLSLIIMCLAYLLSIGKRLAALDVIDAWFIRLRVQASSAVIITLISYIVLVQT